MNARNARRLAAKQAATSRPPLDEWLRDITKQSAGVMEFQIIDPAAFVHAVALASLGDRDAATTAQLVADAVRHLPSDALCLTCDATVELKVGPSFVITRPYAATADKGLGSALCAACASRQDVVGRVTSALQKIWPNARRLVVTHPSGGTA